MRTTTVLVRHPDFLVEDVRCRSPRSSWVPAVPRIRHVVAFVRSGCFARRVGGVETLLDPTTVFFEAPGVEQEFAHPADGGDRSTTISLAPELVASMWGGDVDLPAIALPTSPVLDLWHRVLLAQIARGELQDAEERVVGIVAAALERAEPARVASGRPATAAAQQRLVDSARAALAVDPRRGLVDVAREVAVSPHHLSRLFSALTGQTFSGYRNRVRVRLALDRIAEGERRLARLAAELGFADQAHLTRVVRSETGAPPTHLRKLLAFAHESPSFASRRGQRSVHALPDGSRVRPLVEEAEVRRVR